MKTEKPNKSLNVLLVDDRLPSQAYYSVGRANFYYSEDERIDRELDGETFDLCDSEKSSKRLEETGIPFKLRDNFFSRAHEIFKANSLDMQLLICSHYNAEKVLKYLPKYNPNILFLDMRFPVAPEYELKEKAEELAEEYKRLVGKKEKFSVHRIGKDPWELPFEKAEFPSSSGRDYSFEYAGGIVVAKELEKQGRKYSFFVNDFGESWGYLSMAYVFGLLSKEDICSTRNNITFDKPDYSRIDEYSRSDKGNLIMAMKNRFFLGHKPFNEDDFKKRLNEVMDVAKKYQMKKLILDKLEIS